MAVSGILVMDKPQGFTSFDVIGKLRGILKMKKLGHTGTLDPMATGVLPVLVGTAARACDILPDARKAYRAGFQLGKVTDTQDSSGTVLRETPFSVSREDILRILPAFTGLIDQIPPMYSAVQINGRRLYELARAGREIKRPARQVQVESLTLEDFDEVRGSGTLSVCCGKGTYVRTLIHDIGQRLSCGACMTALTRTMACGFTLAEAHGFEEVQQAAEQDALSGLIIPTDRLFAGLPALRLNAAQSRMYANGVRLTLSRLNLPEAADRLRVYSDSGQFFGLAEPDREAGVLRVYKNL